MRRTNEAFKEEILRRSQAYKAKRSKQRRQLLTLCCCLVLAGGVVLLYPGRTEKLATDSANIESNMAAAAPAETPAEAAPMAPDMDTEEKTTDGAAMESASDRPIAPYMGPDVTQVDVSHYVAGTQERWSAEGEYLEALKEWANGLRYEPVEFKSGQSPGDCEGGEMFSFSLTGGAYPGFSYIITGETDHYLSIEGYWYTVTNPSKPPHPESGTLQYRGRTLNRADLSAETIRWLEWYNSLSEEGQLSVSFVPEELYALCGYPLAEDTEAPAE